MAQLGNAGMGGSSSGQGSSSVPAGEQPHHDVQLPLMPSAAAGQVIRSKYRGLSWDKKHQGWRVRIYFAGKQRHVGRFEDDAAAAKAYDKAAVFLYGSNAITNFGLEACQHDPTEVSAFIVLAKEQADQEQLARAHPRQHSYTATRYGAPAGSVQHLGHQQQAPMLLQTQQVQMLQQPQHFTPGGVMDAAHGAFSGAVATGGAYSYAAVPVMQQQQQQVWMPAAGSMPHMQGMAAATPPQYVLVGQEQDTVRGSAGGPASFVMLPGQGHQHYILQQQLHQQQQQQHMVLAVGGQQHGQQQQVLTAVGRSMPPSSGTSSTGVGPACGAALAGVPQGSMGLAPLPLPDAGGGAGCSSGGGMAAAAANRGIAGGTFVQDMLQGLTYPASPDALPNHNAAVRQPLQHPGAASSSPALVSVVGSSSCAFMGNRTCGGPASMLASGAAAADGSPTCCSSGSSSSIVIHSPQLHATYGFA